jgi:hypothetical protein
MDNEMMDRLIAIQMKHNPQTKIGAAIVITELLHVMREPTDNMLKAARIIRTGDHVACWQEMIDAITGAE